MESVAMKPSVEGRLLVGKKDQALVMEENLDA
jgi:hypothetical protein